MPLKQWVKGRTALIVIEGLMGISLGLIFLKYPIFPSVLSGDYSQHVNTATNIAHGIFPPFSASILYIGVELYLGLAVLMFPAIPLVTVRLAMAFLVLLSPLIIYSGVKVIFNDKVAIWSTALYSLSGYLWFGMVFNSGLWPNFWALLSSVILIAAVIRFQDTNAVQLSRIPYDLKVKSWPSTVLLLFALTNALFSHFSILLLFPGLILYFALKKNWVGLGILIAPVAIGFTLFPNLLSSLLPFIIEPSRTVIQPTFLASVIPLPTLSAMVVEISANFLGDFAALIIFILGGFFLLRMRNDGKMLIMGIWFLVCLLIPVYSSNAWRFAFIGLMPLTIMAGWSLSKLRPKPFLPNGKVFLFLFLFLTPAFGSWSNVSIWDSFNSTFQTSAQQGYDLQAIRWMLSNVPSNCGVGNSTDCGVISANDLNFLYLSYMDARRYIPPLGGLTMYYAPFSNVIFTNALQVQLFAARYGPYIVVSKNGTASAGACDIANTFGLVMTTNATILGINRGLGFKFEAVKGLNTSVALWDNGIRVADVGLIKGHAEISTSYSSEGNHSFNLGLGSTFTSPLFVRVVGSNPTPSSGKTVIVPPDYCQPWSSYNASSMRGWNIIYQNSGVRIYKVAF